MKNKHIYLFLILLVSSLSFSQNQRIFNKEDSKSFLIRYSSNDNMIKKEIFTKLSNQYRVSISSLRINFDFKEHKEILKTGKKMEFLVSLNDIRISGHNKYKGFDVSDALIPNYFNFTLEWLKGTTVLNEYTFKNVSIEGSNNEIVSMSINDSTGSVNYSLKLKNSDFRYSERNRQLFNERTNFIDTYYSKSLNASNKLRWFSQINMNRDYLINLDNFDLIYTYRDSAVSILNFEESARRADFYRNLNIQANDPKNLKSSLSTLKTKANNLNILCNEIISNLDQVYYERGISFLSKRNPQQAEINFNKSLEVNNKYFKSHFQLAKIYYAKGDVDQSVDKIIEIKKMNPDQQTKMQNVEFARGVYGDLLLNSRDLNNNRKYEEAANILSNAEELCRNFFEINCTQDLENSYFKARTGIYANQLKEVEQVLRSGKTYEAEKLIDEAVKYRENFNITKLSSENKLQISIKQTIYNELVYNGKGLYQQKKYEEALNQYDQALQLQDSFKIKANVNLKSYIFNSAKKFGLMLIEDGKNKVNNNDLKNARVLYRQANEVAENYSLKKDRTVNSSLNDLKLKIFKQECENAQKKYDSLFELAVNFISKKDYLKADSELNNAIAHAKDNEDCGIDTRNVLNEKSKIADVVTYLKKINSVNNQIKKRVYKSAIEEYISVGDYFKSKSIEKFGISHKNLFEFISAGNYDFVIYGVGFYTYDKEYENALGLLNELSRRNVKNKYTKDKQNQLAFELAVRDYKQNPGGNYKANIADYSKGNPYFKYFIKAYKKQWKKMD